MAKKILIAEDEKPLANALKLKLSAQGYEIDLAYNGEEAIDKLKKSKYDLLVLDLVMPVVDGFAVLKTIKEEDIKVNIVVSSNLSQDDDMEEVQKYGIKNYFIKSDTPINEIVDYIKKIVK